MNDIINVCFVLNQHNEKMTTKSISDKRRKDLPCEKNDPYILYRKERYLFRFTILILGTKFVWFVCLFFFQELKFEKKLFCSSRWNKTKQKTMSIFLKAAFLLKVLKNVKKIDFFFCWNKNCLSSEFN